MPVIGEKQIQLAKEVDGLSGTKGTKHFIHNASGLTEGLHR